jgi:hypothetical protein
MTDLAPRRKLAPTPIQRRDPESVRPLSRPQPRAGWLPTVTALLRAGAVVSVAGSVGLVTACGHDGKAEADIKADAPTKAGRDPSVYAKVAATVSGVLEAATATPTSTPTIAPPEETIRTAGAVAPVPVPPASTTKIGIATPTPPATVKTPATTTTVATVPTPQRAPGGPMIATPVPPTPTPPIVGGKPKMVTPTPPGTTQAPCPNPKDAPATI